MSEQSEQQPDLAQLWRDWLTQSERQFNSFFNEMMGTEGFSRAMGAYAEMYIGFQRVLAQAMERYLAFVNMPSRADVVSLGETLRVIEGRLSRIEETLLIAAAAVDGAEPRAPPPSEPTRTRQPDGVREAPLEEPAVPEQFRA